ncbi:MULTISPECIES: MsnO8 family LLM class oxidoreductase [Streptosporangium]|uniref:Alkanesulfonate monooxygenase SsuD/methylene tetrahydromethanopterin reductase-like flavin-dependent oxidoreductase (Luciferase family) n=1 Tax=Streptosporangium brasiliense TaxID=47480 RepID=A0ABT9RMX3_9ACTN|nr:MsnO8 family LLM class oxidoreductase [Streptosporangium brasiliense]MDP9870079.1 alkanesulfonate monooxygenase SsuD/methylene tetrahydromethanopterin reductase-like flavin-dependent oxidoreductase (luciferase family) [Streptosporangium brasiliense]
MTSLSILDLSPVPSGGTAGDALRNTLDLAGRAEEFGYRRYWLAEHHFAPGVASAAPAVLIALVAAATSTIRVGSGAVQLGHQTALAVVEQFGLIDALHPGRIDLGLGRSGRRKAEFAELAEKPSRPSPPARVVDGLLIPEGFSFAALAASPILTLYGSLLQQPGARSPDFADQVDDIIALLAGTYRSADGLAAHAVPGEGADVELWVLGSSGGQSAQVAGERGLSFAANYHVSPSTVLEAAEAYREAFKPSATLAAPRLIVSADVVVAEDDDTARELASPYGLWVRSIRTGAGAIPFPTPEEAAAHEWTEEDRALVADRVATQFVGSPRTVAERLRVLRDVTGADELLVTTITHDHADRVRSYELLAAEWATG